MPKNAKKPGVQQGSIQDKHLHLGDAIFFLANCTNFFALIWSVASMIRKSGKMYQFPDCFYLLTLLVCSPDGITINEQRPGRVCLSFFDMERIYLDMEPITVDVVFGCDSITYEIIEENSTITTQFKVGPIITYYIYWIMKHMDVEWMKEVITCVGNHSVKSLQFLCKNVVATYAKNESFLRRLMTPSVTLIRGIARILDGEASAILSGDDYAMLFQRLHYENQSIFTLHKPKKDITPQTLYMHKFNLFSVQRKPELNFYCIPHLLSFEALFAFRHKWEYVFFNCYCCKIEGYHIFIILANYPNDCFLIIMQHIKIGNIMEVPRFYSEHMEVTMHHHLYTFFELDFMQNVLGKHFNNIRWSGKAWNMKQMARCAVSIRLFLKRLGLVAFYKKFLVNSYPSALIEQSKGYKKEIKQYIKESFGDFVEGNKGVEFSCTCKGKVYTNRVWIRKQDMDHIIEKATFLPLGMHYHILKTNRNLPIYLSDEKVNMYNGMYL